MGKIPLEAVYYYRPAPTPHEALLRTTCARFGARFRLIAPADTAQTVGFLIGSPGEERQPGTDSPPIIDEEMLILHHFRGKRIEYLLTALRKAGVPKIGLKAVVTEHNITWSLYALYTELSHEREEFARLETQNVSASPE